MNIYLASSWRNTEQPELVRILKEAGHDVYDFRNPPSGSGGFHWSDIDPNWQQWTPGEYAEALRHPIAIAGFDSDMTALRSCDTCVMLQPCGRSAALELGWACGNGRRTAILLRSGEPELMVSMVDRVCVTTDQLLEWLEEQSNGSR